MSMPRIVFLHIPKTAGTAINSYLKTLYSQEEICPERLSGLRLWPPELLGQYKYFCVHETLYNLKYIPGQKEVFTFLREPIDRLLSTYSFWRSHSNKVIEDNNVHHARLAKFYNLKEFLKCELPDLRIQFNNPMSRYLSDYKYNDNGQLWRDEEELLEAARKNLERLTAVGVYEYLDESINLVCKKLDLLPPAKLQTENVTSLNHHYNPDYFDEQEALEIDDEIEELLQINSRVDRVIYKDDRVRRI